MTEKWSRQLFMPNEPWVIKSMEARGWSRVNGDDEMVLMEKAAMTDKPKPQVYIIRFAIKGHMKLQASSLEEAQATFDGWNISAEEMIADGYDDIEVDEPELLVED